MAAPSPAVVVLGGPNGAGKSTAAPRLLRGSLKVDEFVNADTLAQGLSAFRPEAVAMEAGRLTLARLDTLASQRRSFAFESTLASQSLARRLLKLKEQGYAVHVMFLWLPSVDLALARVSERVRTGGHDVPPETVRRRYERGRHNFFTLYRGWPTGGDSTTHQQSAVRRLWRRAGRECQPVSEPRTAGNRRPKDTSMTDKELTVTELFDDGVAIDAALREAARDARRFHKAMGNPMATWQDGKVVWVQPEDIVVDDTGADRESE